jgi:TPR repeat protein
MNFVFKVAKKGTTVCVIIQVPRPLGVTSIYDVSLTNGRWLRSVDCAFKNWLISLLSSGMGHRFALQVSKRDSHNMMRIMADRVATRLAAKFEAEEAEELCASGQCAAAMVALTRAIYLGDFPSRALKAWLMISGREGVARDCDGAFKLVEEGARLGCHHCQGVMAWCYMHGYGCEKDRALSLELARESSGKGSRYGQWVLGLFHEYGEGGLAKDYAQAVALFRLAAAQNLDAGQCSMGVKYHEGLGVVKNDTEALRLYKLAAAQGQVTALFNVASCYERGIGVPKNTAQAIFWYERAQAAGDKYAGYAVDRLKLL